MIRALIELVGSPRALIALAVAGAIGAGWGLAWALGKRIEHLKASVAAIETERDQFEQAYKKVAAAAVECSQATQRAKAAAEKTQAEAAQAIARARETARTYAEQADALRRATSPPERSCEAALDLVRKELGQ